MATAQSQETKTRSYFSNTTFFYAFDNEKSGGTGDEKDFKVASSELLGGTPGFVRYNDITGYHNTSKSELFFDPTNNYLGIGLSGSPAPRKNLHVHDSTGSDVAIRMTTNSSGVGVNDGVTIESDGNNLEFQFNSDFVLKRAGTVKYYFNANGLHYGGTAVGNSALNMSSINDRGVLLPSLTTSERDSITAIMPSQDGLLIFNNENKSFDFYDYDASSWRQIGGNPRNAAYLGNTTTTLSATTETHLKAFSARNNYGNNIDGNVSGDYFEILNTTGSFGQYQNFIYTVNLTFSSPVGSPRVEFYVKSSTQSSPTVYNIYHGRYILDFTSSSLETVNFSGVLMLQDTTRVALFYKVVNGTSVNLNSNSKGQGFWLTRIGI